MVDIMEGSNSAKAQFRAKPKKKISALQFGVLSSQEIVNQGVVEVSDRHIYDLTAPDGSRSVTKNGPLDRRLGTSSNNGAACETCKRNLKDCNGHFGYVKLSLPVLHVGFLRHIIDILQCICKDCSRVMLEEKPRRQYLKSLRRNLDNMAREALRKRIQADCKKVKYCPHCGGVNGTVKKVAGHALKIIHERYRWYTQSTAKSKVPPPSKVAFDESFEEAKRSNTDVDRNVKKAVDDMNPLRVLNLFRRITPDDCELLAMNPEAARPETLIWQYVPAPPVSIRPSVAQEGASTEDDITNKLGDIIQISSIIRAGIDKGQPVQTIMEQWDYLQIQVAMYINADVPNLQQAGFGKPIRGFCQRLKGKQGRFRGNLSGKRVDFSSRTVISPNCNLGIDEVDVPKRVALTMTYPEVVTQYNHEKLRDCVKRGKNKHPGANFIVKKTTKRRIVLEVIGKLGQDRLNQAAEQLQIGDIVERHLEEGDIVLFNRQPSLHKLSIMSHRAKISEWRTFRLNECVCTPYNADFDGDEMNLHLPQTEEARAEASILMSTKVNTTSPKDGAPIIAATQDFITAAYLLSSKEKFYSRAEFVQLVSYMFHADAVREPVERMYNAEVAERKGFLDIDLPEPCILKPETLWTGKQVFSVLMRPSRKSKVLVNLDAPCKEYRATSGQAPDLSEDTWLCIRNSEIMVGRLDKSNIGSGSKNSIFYVLLRDYGPDAAAAAMNRLSRLAARYLTREGFSIGINDVWASAELELAKKVLVEKSYARCDEFIQQYQKGTLRRDAGCDEEKTMENKVSGELSSVRAAAGAICFTNLAKSNSAVIMAKSGSKGSNINVSQMVAGVGQQMIGGARVADGFQDRTLPHFQKGSRQPPAKGFVRNSFFSGLTPTEFIFHSMSGREGLVDTAVKTAETGYISRRLMKSLEDLSIAYQFGSVRNGSSGIVQFQFGDDNLDPVDMEGKAKPVNFDRTFKHAQTAKGNREDRGLLPYEINDHVKAELDQLRKVLVRKSLKDEELPYESKSLDHVDQLESQRNFLDDVQDYVASKAEDLSKIRTHVGLKDGKTKSGAVDRSREGKAEQLTAERKVSQKSLDHFLQLVLSKYEKAKSEPGHACGAVAAQSIGEPGTQMTLKTFHFAGVAGMSMTQGVPRIKEIINASKVISTPIIRCELFAKESEPAARLVKGKIEKTYLKDVMKYVEECWTDRKCHLRLKIDFDTVNDLQLDVNMIDIGRALVRTRGLGIDSSCVHITGPYMNVSIDPDPDAKKGRKTTTKTSEEEAFLRLQALKRLLPDVVIKGYPDAQRAIIAKKVGDFPKGKEPNELLVEGYGLKACMTTTGVDGYKTRSNSVMEMNSVLGIEAARTTIIAELDAVMGSQMGIDPRHMALLADVMTYKGEVLGITRFGLAKMRDSVLQLASFEKTTDHLFDAAVKGKKDLIEGVSECIIMGRSMTIGTGAMKVVRNLKLNDAAFEKKKTLFEDLWAEYGKDSKTQGGRREVKV